MSTFKSHDDILCELHENYINQVTESGMPQWMYDWNGGLQYTENDIINSKLNQLIILNELEIHDSATELLISSIGKSRPKVIILGAGHDIPHHIAIALADTSHIYPYHIRPKLDLQNEMASIDAQIGMFDNRPKVELNATLIPVTPRNKVGRNDPCSCGSGKKDKKCCKNYLK